MTILPVYSTSTILSHVVYVDNSDVGYAFNRHAPYMWAVPKMYLSKVTR